MLSRLSFFRAEGFISVPSSDGITEITEEVVSFGCVIEASRSEEVEATEGAVVGGIAL